MYIKFMKINLSINLEIKLYSDIQLYTNTCYIIKFYDGIYLFLFITLDVHYVITSMWYNQLMYYK